jgi:ABC-type nickel/cobalt efflux system permease component RcnA
MLSLSGVLIVVAGAVVLLSPLLEDFLQARAKKIFRGVSSLSVLAVIAGMAPCPGVFLILVFSSVVGAMPVGILSVIAVSIGMAITVSTMGTIGGAMRTGMAKGRQHPFWGTALQVSRIAAGCLIVGVGLVMATGHY